MHIKIGINTGDFHGGTNIAIQQAVDAAGHYGGGTVEITAGTYTLYNSIRLRRNVRLAGAGAGTVLRKADGVSSRLVVDADYGQMKVTAEDVSGFRAGMGVVISDDRAGGWIDTLATVTLVQGNVIYVDTPFVMDYNADRDGLIINSFPLISGVDIDSAVVEGMVLDGNREANLPINGCIGGGIYFHRARNCRVSDCTVQEFAGDSISFQTTQDITVERCEIIHGTGLGLHPGTGSVRPIIRHCRTVQNDEDGFFLCWRVQEGRFEHIESFDNGRYGISIGHKDTNNLFLDNVIRGNAGHGIYFREEKASNAGGHNTFRGNVIEDNRGCGVYIEGETTDLLFEDNTIRDTRSGEDRTQRIGLWAGPKSARLRAIGNRIENHVEAEVQGEVEVG